MTIGGFIGTFANGYGSKRYLMEPFKNAANGIPVYVGGRFVLGFGVIVLLRWLRRSS
jgi:hypothetical protein